MNDINKDIEILESECYYLEELGYLRENNHFIRFNQALENLIKGYRKLEKRIISLTNLLCINDSDKNYIPKSKIKEIRDKAEVMDYYVLGDVIEDLNKLLGDEK